MTMPIESGSQVTLHFTLRLADEDVLVDSTREDGEPFTFIIGSGEVIPGLEQRLLGMDVGQQAKFEVPALEAYGPASVDPETVHNIPRDEFPPEMELEPGQIVGFTAPNGDEVPGIIMGFTDEVVTVDFTHPLAGHDLLFEVEILAVEAGEPGA
jgi:FKBP-type peptidyl-prolyl cis-trans isomerase SlpA